MKFEKQTNFMKYTKFILIASLITLGLAFQSSKISSDGKHSEINWMTFEQMQEAQKKKPKKVIVDMYTDWCGWCKKMDKTTFENPVIAKYVNENFYAVKFNAESKESVVFNGKKYENSGRYHELATSLMQGKLGFPTSIYLDEKLGYVTEPIASYLDAKQFEVIISYINTEGYKKQPFDKFQQSFKSQLAQ
jgi:thioredoxin-related protein